MNKLIILFFSLALSWQALANQSAPFNSPLKIEDIFRPSDFRDVELSPNGKYFSAHTRSEAGQFRLHIIERATMKEVNRVQFDDPKLDVGSSQWISHDRVLFTVITTINEFENPFVAASLVMNIDGTEKRRLWDGKTNDGRGAGGQMMGRADEDHFYMMIYPSGASNNKFPYTFLYKLNINTGKTKRIMRSPARGGNFIINNDGEVTHSVGYDAESFDIREVYYRTKAGEWKLESRFHNKEGGKVPIEWSADGKSILYENNINQPTRGLYWVNAETRKETLIYRHSNVDVSARSIHKDAAGRIWGVKIEYDFPKTIILDPTNREAQLYRQMTASFEGARIQFKRFSPISPEYLVHVSSDRELGKYYLFNELDGQLKFLVANYGGLSPEQFGQMHPIRYNARDGLEINGYLTLPPNTQPVDAVNLPMILLPHGGPYGVRDFWGANRETLVLANAGYAVLQVNFRGSGGYGKDFYYDAYQKWGLEMQDDLTDAVNWAVGHGIADKDRVCIYGASYGGFAAMSGMWKTPDMFKCGIGYVGVYDMNIFANLSDTETGAAGRTYFVEGLGADPKKRFEQSPLAHVDKMKNPIMLIHGGRDVRVHIKHYYELREALLEKNHRFETLVAPRAGHGTRDLLSQREIYCRMIDFFDRHIGHKQPQDEPDGSCKSIDALVPLKYEYFKGE